MISAAAFTLKGNVGDPVDLTKAVFGHKSNPALVSQAVRVYLANQRKAVAKTKTRSEVEGSTRKIFKQKGTGNARHGSVRAPIFVGGGIAFGPDGRQNHTMTVSKKQNLSSLFSILSARAKEKKVVIIKSAEKATGKTKESADLFTKIFEGKTVKGLVVVSNKDNAFARACRNLAKIEVLNTANLSTYKVVKYPNLILTEKALDEIEKKYVA